MFGRVSRDNGALVPFLTLRIEFARFCDWLTKRVHPEKLDPTKNHPETASPDADIPK
ncbi:MAG: hypothetical protein V7776_11455 [Halopseudomonas aestusnigri]